ncbi:fucose-binding lectin [Dyella sp. M7H15-1]|uniref:fucose-binding lectin II n=1 Tax=Dyella sp. M7H15-1 TaxID=2501295 RepID=UPI00100521C4|nr:fucose-binding lectin II [Dyella sp. M7H15-1]QAU24307.1 fucose-binding lectin [Dyella sp. M7H15-1]
MPQQYEFSIPPNTQFGVTAHACSSGNQLATIYVDGSQKAQFTGSGIYKLIGDQTLNSGSGKIKVTVTANGKPCDMQMARSMIASDTNFITVGAEDGTDNDYNDTLVDFKWPIG